MRLSPSEKLLIFRLNRGWTQRRAAEHWGVGFWTYHSWEHDPNVVPQHVRSLPSEFDQWPGLRYIILRRREGMTQSALGKELGVSRQWVNRMEQGLEDDQLIRDYWAT